MSDFVDFCSALGLRASAVVRDAEARLAQTPTEADDFDWDAEIARNLREREEAARILASYDLAAQKDAPGQPTRYDEDEALANPGA